MLSPVPIRRPGPSTITPWSLEAIGCQLAAHAFAAPASAVNPSAQTGYYVPFVLAVPWTAKEVGWMNGSIVGNGGAQVGIYDTGGNEIVECTKTTTSGANAWQTIDITDTLLQPGRYYMALNCGNVTDRYFSIAPTVGVLTSMGCLEEAVGTDLPATATFATPTHAYLPLFFIAGHTLL